jgi:hypothetical protein
VRGNIDWIAVRAGALVAIAICLPIALLQQVLVDTDDANPSGVVYLLYLAILVGFVLGGWQAGKRATGTPYTSGAVAALCGFIAIQTAGVIARLIDGDEIRVVLIVTNGLLAYGAGLLGAGIAARRQRVPG